MPEQVIELNHGETAEIIIVKGAHRAKLHLRADRVLYVDANLTARGSIGPVRGEAPFFEDPVAAAALKERERCKTALRAWCDSHHFTDQTISELVVAIDGPDEEVSAK